MKTILLNIFLLAGSILFAQQNEEFKMIKQHFDYQENLLKTEFINKYKLADNELEREAIKKDFAEFMLKLDSIRNTAYLGALIRVKNIEELKYLNKDYAQVKNIFQDKIDEVPEFPNGIDALREKVASLFYAKGFCNNKKELNTTVNFAVDKDGSIIDIRAEGEDVGFNKQAEIAMYLIPDKFIKPAIINGNAVKYSYKMPLTIKFN